MDWGDSASDVDVKQTLVSTAASNSQRVDGHLTAVNRKDSSERNLQVNSFFGSGYSRRWCCHGWSVFWWWPATLMVARLYEGDFGGTGSNVLAGIWYLIDLNVRSVFDFAVREDFIHKVFRPLKLACRLWHLWLLFGCWVLLVCVVFGLDAVFARPLRRRLYSRCHWSVIYFLATGLQVGQRVDQKNNLKQNQQCETRHWSRGPQPQPQ